VPWPAAGRAASPPDSPPPPGHGPAAGQLQLRQHCCRAACGALPQIARAPRAAPTAAHTRARALPHLRRARAPQTAALRPAAACWAPAAPAHSTRRRQARAHTHTHTHTHTHNTHTHTHTQHTHTHTRAQHAAAQQQQQQRAAGGVTAVRARGALLPLRLVAPLARHAARCVPQRSCCLGAGRAHTLMCCGWPPGAPALLPCVALVLAPGGAAAAAGADAAGAAAGAGGAAGAGAGRQAAALRALRHTHARTSSGRGACKGRTPGGITCT
jgi:hypothetical protein